MLCSCFEIKVYRNLRREGYVSRMVEKWWCLHPLWRGNMWTGYSSMEDTSRGSQAASWTPVRQISISVREWGDKSKCHKFSDQPRSSQGFSGGSDCRESVWNVGDPGWIPGEGNDHPLQWVLAWKIPWVEEPGGLQSIGPQRVRRDWATSLQEFANFRKLWVVCGVMVKNNWLKTTRFLSFFISRQETFSSNQKKVVFSNWENLFWESCTVLGITKSTQQLTKLHSFVVRKLLSSSRRR